MKTIIVELTNREIRLNKMISDLQIEHVGNEEKFTYWGGYRMGYLKGRLSAIEDIKDKLLDLIISKDKLNGHDKV